MAWHRVIVLVCCVLVACGRPAGATVPAPVPRAESVESSPAAELGIVGVWLGYGDELRFASRSDRVQLIITSVGADGQVTGTVAFGEPGTLAPLSESDVADSDDGGFEGPIERFSYTLAGSYDAALSRLEVAFVATELWADWCAQQTSYLGDRGRYACLPDCPIEPPPACRFRDCPARPGKFECGHHFLCLGNAHVCDCDASGCRTNARRPIALDLHHEGDELEGPLDRMGKVFLERR